MKESVLAILFVSYAVFMYAFLGYIKSLSDTCNDFVKNKGLTIARWAMMIGLDIAFIGLPLVYALWYPVTAFFWMTFAAISVMMVYLTLFIGNNGIPPSLSDTFYLGMRYKFTILCYVVSFLIIPVMVELSADKWFQFMSFFACGGLLLVGTAPLFKSHENTIHVVGASIAAIFSLAWIILMGYWFIPAVYLIIALLIISKCQKATFWLEMACFASIFLTLIIL